MILLDTNVITEPLKPNGDPKVVAWIDAQVLETLYLSTISVAELWYGIAALPDGKRKSPGTLKGRASARPIVTLLPLQRPRVSPSPHATSRPLKSSGCQSSIRGSRGSAHEASEGLGLQRLAIRRVIAPRKK